MDKYTISLPVIDKCISSNGRYDIEKTSSQEMRAILETFAGYFKKEFKYDHIQYEADEHLYDDHKYHGLLFTEAAFDAMTEEHSETPTRLIGGCCFRWREFSDRSCWVLDWVWLHPFCRHRGILRSHWGALEKQFGDFGIIEGVRSTHLTK
nr:hypothetical protein [Desulfobulbaceae bacterium]